MKEILKLLLPVMLILSILPFGIRAEETEAKEISGIDIVTDRVGIAYPAWLFNKDRIGWQTSQPNSRMTLRHEEGIGSVYLVFHKVTGEYTLINEDTGEEAVCGQEGFLHDFVNVTELFGKPPKALTLCFGEEAPQISEMRVFTEGKVPEDVQQWKLAPEEGVDLLVFPTHGDDEQLFFAGLLPYYAGEKGYETQIVYSTDHGNYGPTRPHEMLDGLWAVGVTNYPVFGPFPDFLTDTEAETLETIKPAGYDQEDVFAFVVENIRRFKPLVAVGHDLNGEYGHGFHRLYGHMLKDAVEVSNDPQVFPESAEKYGIWDVPKTYLHLYEENSIHMNWDIPLERFDGMTAYQVTKQRGFPAHVSQYPGFYWYFADHDTAESISENGPCDYGLCRSTVGEDVQKNDLFENLNCRAVQKQLEEEKRLAEEKQKLEEQKRMEQEQQEAQIQAEQEAAQQKAREEARKLADQEKARTQKRMVLLLSGLVLAGVLSILLIVRIRK